MQIVGKVTDAQLMELKRRGMSPQQAHEALTAEARARHPGAQTIIVQRSSDGFEIVVL